MVQSALPGFLGVVKSHESLPMILMPLLIYLYGGLHHGRTITFNQRYFQAL